MLQLSNQERRLLLGVARRAVRSYLTDTPAKKPGVFSPSLSTECGVFVSIHREAELRGCIGRIESEGPLYEVTPECAVSAAVSEPRFPPVRIEELEGLRFEISVLSVLQEVEAPDTLEVGRHGLLVEKGGLRGLLLPQVAAEYGWDRAEFLSQTCVKAGLSREAWQEGAQIFSFEALVFGEGVRAE